MSSNTSSDALGAPQVPETSEVLNEVVYDTTELLVEERTSSDESSDSEDEYIARGEDKNLFQTLTSKPKTKNDKSKQAAAPGGDPSEQAKEPPKTSVPNNDQYPPRKSPKKK